MNEGAVIAYVLAAFVTFGFSMKVCALREPGDEHVNRHLIFSLVIGALWPVVLFGAIGWKIAEGAGAKL